jgi:two-component system sensor histidine kinase UhpB
MSLRLRVLAAIALVLLLAVTAGTALAGLEARRSLRAELTAAVAGGRQTVNSAYEDLPHSDHPGRDMRQLLSTFDGNRHLTAALVDVRGHALLTSTSAPGGPRAPRWFRAFFANDVKSVTLPAPVADSGYAAVVLRPAPENDLDDAWLQFGHAMAAFGFACAAGLVLVYLTIGRALRPLDELSNAFVRLGGGDYGARIAESGPTELARVGRGFNGMAERLEAVQARNRALEEQLLRLQDEERADLARDLHDEIGPHLFAVNVDASMIGQLDASGRHGEIAEQVRAIQASVSHIQRFVRDMLGRLRPTQLVELGLAAAVDDLVAFWRARRPEIAFEVDLSGDDDALPEAVREVIYRVVQESLSNAVRHAGPARIAVKVAMDGAQSVAATISDDGAAAPGAPMGVGFGLVGMRERVESLGGRFAIERGVGGWSWTVTARLPLEIALP